MRRHLFATLLLSGSLLASPAFAQATDPAAADHASPATTDVVVTGSRVPGRTVADSPVPIDVIGGDQLQNSGYTETNKVLNQLVPSFNFRSRP